MKRSVLSGGQPLEYILIQSKRKSVLMQALPEGVTKVYAPAYMRLKDIDAMVRKKIPELKQMHERLDNELRRSRLEHPVSPGSRICVEGKGLRLILEKGERISMKIDGESCILRLKEPENEEAVRHALKQALSRLALRRIREELGSYAPRIGVEFGRVAIRDQKSRWGSCSAKRNLNFNWKLIMAPPQALEYVVIHELCHLIEFNHSPRFWRLVESQMPEYESWKKWLKTHGSELGV
ncbi:MAG: M48 family metallopeptidase [Clostridia bacterium]|nr:M48 family metallopeptidase [Clostridia bacterium]